MDEDWHAVCQAIYMDVEQVKWACVLPWGQTILHAGFLFFGILLVIQAAAEICSRIQCVCSSIC